MYIQRYPCNNRKVIFIFGHFILCGYKLLLYTFVYVRENKQKTTTIGIFMGPSVFVSNVVIYSFI